MKLRGWWIGLVVFVLIAHVVRILGGGMMTWGTTGPGSCTYWPGS